MLQENPNKYLITYSNSFLFEGALLAFRKKELFNISGIPKWIPFNDKANCWLVNRKQLTVSKSKELITDKNIAVDVSDLQWYLQENLNGVFNLNT